MSGNLRTVLLWVVLVVAGLVGLEAQPGVVMPHPKIQFLDNSGNPLSGGKLYFYVAGTTTQQDT